VVSAESTASDHPAHDYFVQRYARLIDEVAQAYRVMRDADQLVDGVNPQLAARQLIALMDGLQVQWLLDNDGVDMASALREHLQRHIKVSL